MLSCPDGASFKKSEEPRPAAWCEENGNKHGPLAEWHENGCTSRESYFHHGKESGTTVFWYPTGHRYIEMTFEQGKESGPVIAWHPNGRRLHGGTLQGGERNGRWVEYHPTLSQPKSRPQISGNNSSMSM